MYRIGIIHNIIAGVKWILLGNVLFCTVSFFTNAMLIHMNFQPLLPLYDRSYMSKTDTTKIWSPFFYFEQEVTFRT